MKSKNSIYKIVTVGDISRIHLGNAFCLLAGFVMGPIGGGLASGIGAMLYDLTNPAYIASAPFTFVFKFLLAAVCGLIAHKGKITGNMLEEDFTITVPRSIVAGICGSLTLCCISQSPTLRRCLRAVRRRLRRLRLRRKRLRAR